MRIIPRASLAALVLLLLAGCVPGDPTVTPLPDPSSTPVFASDEDALAAATAAYAAYVKVSDQILHDGGANPERIEEFATKKWARVQIKDFDSAAAKGWRGVGTTSFDGVQLESYDPAPSNGVGAITIYLCVDVSGTDVVDGGGVSVVSASRPARASFEVSFDMASESDPKLLVGSEDPWSGSGIC